MERSLPDDPLQFIQRCVKERKVLWTYHVKSPVHSSVRQVIVESYASYVIIEEYPDDKYLPSYFV